MNSNSNNNPDPPDPFDPKSLRIDPSNDPGSGVKKQLLHVPVGKPNPQEFFRCRPDPDYRVRMAILELKKEREFYAVTPLVAADLVGEVRSVEMRVCIYRSGAVSLWPVTLPTEDGRSNAWHETAREAADLAETKWVRVKANMGTGCNDIWTAPDGLPDPNWPEHSFGDLLRLGFGKGRLIDTFEHPVVKRLRGQ